MLTAAQAKQIAAQAEKITHCYGKIIALMAKGLYEYGYKETAEKLLFGKHALLNPDGSLSAYVDWVSAIDNDDLPETVYECMHNPPIDFGAEKNWGDLSHPDSAISDIIATYIGGIRNIGTGFDKVLIKPEPYECKKAKMRRSHKIRVYRIKLRNDRKRNDGHFIRSRRNRSRYGFFGV